MHWQPTLGYADGGQDLTDAALYHLALAPFGEATSLPAFAYRSHAFSLLEDEQIWTRSWVPVGAPVRIGNPGDLLPFTVGNHGIHLRRDARGSLRAWFNFAQHGGCRFVPRQCQTGNKTDCFYTSCGFSKDRDVVPANADGSDVPEMYMFAGINPAKLVPVPVKQVGPLAFVCLRSDADPLEDQLEDLGTALESYQETGLLHLQHATAEGRFNWKLFTRAEARLTPLDSGNETHVGGFPNISVRSIGDMLIVAHAQPVGMERTMVHADFFQVRRAGVTSPLLDDDTSRIAICRSRLAASISTAELLHKHAVDALSAPAREDDPWQWRFHRWYVPKLVARHRYVEQPIFTMPGRESNAGVNSGPF
ncbi:MAG: hypothetical protein IPK20_20340 [Betaproteobacteria bacterium]|nr:hypothetical protein [Betaproteobacteria bacterium]